MLDSDDDSFYSSTPPFEEPDDRSSRVRLRNAFLVICGALAIGGAGLYSYLDAELRRIEPSRRIALCLEEVPTLLWFLWFVAKHSWLGKPFRSIPCATQKTLPREWWLAVITISMVLFLKGHMAFMLMTQESVALNNAALADGEITDIRRKVRKGAYIYVYQGRFQDQIGISHDFHGYANERHQRGWLQPLSQQTRQVLKNGVGPARVAIAYDPDLPARNWVEGIDDDQWRLYKFLGYLVIIQAVFFYNFALALAIHIRRQKEIPWWRDLHMVLPLVVTSVCFVFGGFMVGLVNPLLDLAFGN